MDRSVYVDQDLCTILRQLSEPLAWRTLPVKLEEISIIILRLDSFGL